MQDAKNDIFTLLLNLCKNKTCLLSKKYLFLYVWAELSGWVETYTITIQHRCLHMKLADIKDDHIEAAQGHADSLSYQLKQICI